MLKNRQVVFLIAAIAVLALLACDAGTVISMINPTATPTRTPRPTFTPRVIASPTPEESPTPIPSPTRATSPTPTQRVVATSKPAATKPPAPTAVPVPQFPVTLSQGYFCEQPQSPIWKVTGRINRTGSSYFLGGYTLGVFAADGGFLKASAPSAYDGNQTVTIGGNCRAEKWYQSNLEIDVTEFRGQLPLIIRMIRSASDRTAISKDFRLDFPTPGHYFVEYSAAQ